MDCMHLSSSIDATWFPDSPPVFDCRCDECGTQVEPPSRWVEMARKLILASIVGHPEQFVYEDGDGRRFYLRDLPARPRPA